MKAIANAVPIKLEDVEELKDYLYDLILNEYHYTYVGSIGKKPESSDVDIAILAELGTFCAEHVHLCSDAKLSQGFNLASIPIPFKGNTIQLDIFFTDNLLWTHFILNGTRERNQLLMAAVICKTKKYLNPGLWEQSNIRLPSGLWKVTKTCYSPGGTLLKHPRILNQEFISNSPIQILQMIDIPWGPDTTFEFLWEHLKDNEEVVAKFNDYKGVTIS